MSYGLIENMCAALRTGKVSEKALNAFRQGGILAAVAEMLADGVVTTADLEAFIASKAKPVSATIERWRKLSDTAIEVNLDAPDYTPSFQGAERAWAPPAGNRGWARVERIGEDVYVGGKRVDFHIDDRQKAFEPVYGFEIRDSILALGVHDPRILDALFENTHLLSDAWKWDEKGRTRFIMFWAVGYNDEDKRKFVRSLFCAHGSIWVKAVYNLDGEWPDQFCAAFSES